MIRLTLSGYVKAQEQTCLENPSKIVAALNAAQERLTQAEKEGKDTCSWSEFEDEMKTVPEEQD